MTARQMVGTLPTQLGLLTSLDWLQVQRNSISGSLPIQLARRTCAASSRSTATESAASSRRRWANFSAPSPTRPTFSCIQTSSPARSQADDPDGALCLQRQPALWHRPHRARTPRACRWRDRQQQHLHLHMHLHAMYAVHNVNEDCAFMDTANEKAYRTRTGTRTLTRIRRCSNTHRSTCGAMDTRQV